MVIDRKMQFSKEVRNKAPDGFEWVPPDGKWAWAVLVGATVISFCTAIPTIAFGVMLEQMIMKMNTDTSTITWAISIRTFLSTVLGPAITILMSRVSCRKMVIIGGIGGSLSMIASAFAPNVELLWVTFGILGGIAHSFIQIPLQVTLARYFKKYYALAIGFYSAGFAISRAAITPVAQLALETYGVEGTFFIVGGMFLHIVLGASVFQPVRWHQRLVPIDPTKMIKLQELGETNDATSELPEKKSKLCCKPSTIDLTVLKEAMFYLLVFHSMVQTTTVQYGAIFMFPFGVNVGLKPMEAAGLVSTRSISEIVGRLTGPIIISTFFKTRLLSIFVGGLMVNGCVLLGISFMGPDIGIYVVAVLYGLAFGTVISLSQVVVVTTMGVDRLSSVIGIKNFAISFLTFGTGPLIGWIRDVTGNYRNCYRFLSGMEFALGLVWIAVLALQKHKRR